MSTAPAPTYLRYTLTLRSPVIVSTRVGPPGNAVTQPFIPGSAIRGTVAARLLAENVSGDDDVFRTLVLTGAVRYLHAYPALVGTRALPLPASWRSDRDGINTHDLAAYSGRMDVDDDPHEAWPAGSLASVGKPFTSATSSSGVRNVAAPRIDARLHQQRDRVKGRAWKEDDEDETRHGAIFPSEYLEAGQVFHGVIQVLPAASEQIERIKALLSRSILLGRSRRSGYGGEAEIVFGADGRNEYDHVAGRLSKDIVPGQRFRLMLVSAYIGRHPVTGQMDPAALEHDIRDRLGDVTVERRRWSFEELGSFNRKWRLEVPQTLGVAAGSVLVLEARTPIRQSILWQVEHEGLGERRVEGFGRVLFLLHSDDEREIRVPPESEEPDRLADTKLRGLDSSETSRKHLEFIEMRIVLAAARAEIDRVAADIVHKAERVPSSSLLGRLRTLFRGVHDQRTAERALGELARWCDDNETLSDGARSKLDACCVGRDSLRQWMKSLAALAPDCWSAIVAASGNASTLTGLVKTHHLTHESAAEKILEDGATQLAVQLIDTVLATMCRRAPKSACSR